MKKLLVQLMSVLASFSCLNAIAEIANVAGNGTADTSLPLWAPGKWDIRKLVDGDKQGVFHLDTAPDVGANYTLDLGKDYSIKELRIYPRQDGCCPERLKQVRVSVHKDNQGQVGTEVWGKDLFTDGTNAGAKAGGIVSVTPPSAQTGRWIQIKTLENPVQNYALQMTELEVFADVPASEVNRAVNTLATANQPLYGSQSINSLVDGNRAVTGANTVHGQQNLNPGFAYDINLGTIVNLSRIVIWARQDTCCPDRLSNYRVSVRSDNNGKIGDVVWKADLHTDGSNPGADPGSKDVLTASLDPKGSFKGQWIRIESLDNPVPSYALQMTEVEAFGEPVGAATLLITGQPKDGAAGLGLTATFAVVASAPGGDATKITYQWQKNGVNIAGATAANYTTPATTTADDKAKFRCVVSYPGLASKSSDEAALRLNLAYHAKAFSNRPLWAPGGWNIDKLVNGNRTDVFHLDTQPETGAAYEVDLGAVVKLDEIDIWARQDGCCPDRLTNFRVSVHQDNGGKAGTKVWSADFFTDGTNPGASAGTVVRITPAKDPTGKFEGQWIRIESLEEVVQNYALQMTELEVFGSFASSLALLSILQDPVDYGTAPGRVAKFAVSAKVINGDAANISYQWQKGGVNIAGATAATYTTIPLTDADLGSKYRCIISFPGVAGLTSKEATVSFDYNYAKGQPAYSNRPLWVPGNWNIQMLTDGNRKGVFHLDTKPAAGAAYEVDLGGDISIDKIDIYPRQDGCCPGRLTNIRVSVHKDNNGKIGDQVWKADLFTDGSNAGSSGESLVTLTKELDPTGTFKGQWIRILSIEDPVQDYALQMDELEVYGKMTSSPRPVLAFVRTANSLKLSWTSGTLETAGDVSGTYTAVQNATSPFDVPFNSNRRFYRLKQ
jgi:hypothetical protein